MGAAWRAPRDRDLDLVAELVGEVKSLGLETCVTLGMLTGPQAERLKDGGARLLQPQSGHVRVLLRTDHQHADLPGPAGHARARARGGDPRLLRGILGMGESREDRGEFLRTLANLPEHPESVPINMLVRVEGTPLADEAAIDPLDFVRTIAVARILMPASFVRLSAGRETMSAELQALCFLAGANSIFLRREAADNAQPGHPRRPKAVRPARAAAIDTTRRRTRRGCSSPRRGPNAIAPTIALETRKPPHNFPPWESIVRDDP